VPNSALLGVKRCGFLREEGVEVVTLGQAGEENGLVTTREDAARWGKLFQEHRYVNYGILVTLPDFGEEKAVAQSIRHANL
jgi:L-fucose isomerase-like protein